MATSRRSFAASLAGAALSLGAARRAHPLEAVGRENIKIALPAALLTLVLLAVVGDASPVEAAEPASPWLVLPYVLVLALAVSGLDVLVVLTIGLAVAGAFGFFFGPQDYGLPTFTDDIYAGFEGVVEITLLALFIGGLGALMKASGGLHWLAGRISRLARGSTGRRTGEWCIAALASLTDVFTANNTVAILISGGVARDIAERIQKELKYPGEIKVNVIRENRVVEFAR